MIIRIANIGIAAGLLIATGPLSVLAVSPSDLPPDTPVSQILSLASSALSSGSSQDALSYYDIAVSRDPSNYLTLFKRGATYLSLGRAAQASSDFDKVLALKPGFEGALTQRAKIRARAADWSGAREDYTAAGKESELTALVEAEGAAKLAREAAEKNDWEDCVRQSSVAIMTAAAALDLRQLRARCRLEKGEVTEAVSDLHHVLQINPSMTEPSLRISALTFYSMGETAKGLEGVRKCLHSDPDQKDCTRLFKREKKIDKEMKKLNSLLEKRTFSGAVKLLVGLASDEPGLIQKVKDDIKEFRELGYLHPKAPEELVTKLLETTCDSYLEMNNPKRGAPHCAELLKRSPNALPGLMHRAQAEIDADDFEGALRTLNTAKEHHGQTQKINEMMQKAQTLLKRSKTKDYYKVLGIDRDASTREIKRAYLRMSKQNHPDKVSGDDKEKKVAAEKKMAAINEAYEVLKDPELKARFDNGDDPNDPESQARGHGGPFQGSPFGGHQQFHFRSGGGGGFPGGFPGGGFEQMFGGGGGGFQFQFP